MAINVGSFVNYLGTYNVSQVVESLPAPGPDPYWRLVTWGGDRPYMFQAPQSQMVELTFAGPPAPFGIGDEVEVRENNLFWFNPAVAGVPVGRGIIVFAMSAGPVDVAWVQLAEGRPAVLALWASLTRLRAA